MQIPRDIKGGIAAYTKVINSILGYLRGSQLRIEGLAGWSQTTNGILPPPISSDSTEAQTGPWSLSYNSEDESYSCRVGTVIDYENKVDILESTSEFTGIENLDCIYLEIDAIGLDLLTQTVEEATLKCGKWSSFPDRYTYDESGDIPGLEYCCCALWQFHATEQTSDPTCIKLGNWYLTRKMPPSNLEVINDIASITDKYTGSTIWLRPGAGYIESPD